MTAGRRARWRAALVLTGLGVTGVGCFTDPINRPPSAPLIHSDSPVVMRGKDASFTATASDPDSDSVTLAWARTSGPCSDLSHPPQPSYAGERFPVNGEDITGPFCVWAFATDRYGAMAVGNFSADPVSSPPVAKIRLLSPQVASLYQLYTTFVLSSDSVDADGAPLMTGEWKFDVQPSGAMKQLLATGCPSDVGGTDVHCFKADVPGHYEVVLTVTTADGSSMDRMSLDVNVDTFPCIDVPSCVPMLADSPTLDPTVDQFFKVQMVTDDGDASPFAQFNWFFTVNGALLPFEHNYSILPIPHDQYHEGDVSKIRVEVYDRNRQAIIDALSHCGDLADTCAGDPQRPTCYQRVTWTVNWL